jgi:hypothetical protein
LVLATVSTSPHGKPKKRVIRIEDSEDEKTIIREREQFVHELALAFANGETALIE